MKLYITQFILQSSYTATVRVLAFGSVTELQTHSKRKKKQFLTLSITHIRRRRET
jgi:hypothetical protein